MGQIYLKIVNAFYGILTKLGITRGQDKILHFTVGFLIVFVLMFLVPKLIAVSIGMAAGPLKELWDWKKSNNFNNFDFFDMFATMVGAFGGIIGYSLVKFGLTIIGIG